MAGNLREQNMEVKEPGNQFVKLIPRFAFTAFLAVVLLAVSASPVFADTIFDTAKNAMQTVYKDVAGIATVAAVVCSAVCLFLMNFSKSGRTVDESRSWLKRIIVSAGICAVLAGMYVSVKCAGYCFVWKAKWKNRISIGMAAGLARI